MINGNGFPSNRTGDDEIKRFYVFNLIQLFLYSIVFSDDLPHPEKKSRSFRHTFFWCFFLFFSIIFLRKMSFLPSCDKERVSHWSSPPMSFLMAPWRGSACSRESRALPRTRVSYGDKDAVRASFRGCHKNPFLALEYK